MEMKLDRKSFFERIGKASLFIAFSSVLPTRMFSAKRKIDQKVKIEIHHSAVKRFNKV